MKDNNKQFCFLEKNFKKSNRHGLAREPDQARISKNGMHIAPCVEVHQTYIKVQWWSVY